MHAYFYEKRFHRRDGEVYVKRYSRSFPLTQPVALDSAVPKFSNVGEASASRAKSKVRYLAFCNPQLIGLLTLTFRDIPTEEVAQARFKEYRRQVGRQFPGWQFLGVRELQKRGSIHYHLLVNFCPGETFSPNNHHKRISSLWQYGFSDYSLIRGDDRWRTELYLLKYLAKDKIKLFKSYYVRSRKLNTIEPRYYDTREPLHPLADNVYLTTIKPKKDMESFTIMEYTYSINRKGWRGYGSSELGTNHRRWQE